MAEEDEEEMAEDEEEKKTEAAHHQRPTRELVARSVREKFTSTPAHAR